MIVPARMETSITPGQLFLAVAALFVLYSAGSIIIGHLSAQSRYLRSQNWVQAQQKRWFGESRARLASFTNTRQVIFEGYEKFSRKGKSFVLPQVGGGAFMLLTPTQTIELLQKPDNEIDLMEILKEIVAARWTGDNDIAKTPIHLDIVRHQLTRKLPLLAGDVYDELVLGFEDQWKANSKEYTKVPASKTCATIVSRAANRVFSGAELCRIDEFLESSRVYGGSIFAIGGLISILPWFLRPLIAPIIARWNRRHIGVCKKYAVPVIKKRIAEIQSGVEREPKNDALEWVIEECIKRGLTSELDPDRLCRRIMRLNMVAIHTTSLTITNTLLDLYSSPRVDDFVEGLREECSRVLAKNGGKWSKAAVNELYRVDSTIKESMRYSSLGAIGAMRTITKPGGIQLSDGIHIPQGVRVAAPNIAIHRDTGYYPHADQYDAFRFSKSREEFDGQGKLLDKRNLGIITTGESFLAFGHGKHACPGRFFASQEMKLMLAHIVLTYDVRIKGERPPNHQILAGSIPNGKAMLEIRLRQN